MALDQPALFECREALAAAEFDGELRTDAEAEDILAGLRALPATTHSSAARTYRRSPGGRRS